MRTHGSVDDVHELALGDHVAWCGDGPAAFGRLAVAVFRAASPQHRLVLVCDDPSVDHLAALPDRDRLLAEGRLLVVHARESYEAFASGGPDFDPATQLGPFQQLVDTALADGYTGVRVVADNTSMLLGPDDSLERWQAWELVTDRWQSGRPVSGVCFFDRLRVDPQRLRDVAALHPLVSGVAPSLRLYADGDVLRVRGALEAEDDEWLRRRLTDAAGGGTAEIVVDLEAVDYVHHRPLLAFADVAALGVPVRLRHAPSLVRRQFELLGLAGRIALD